MNDIITIPKDQYAIESQEENHFKLTVLAFEGYFKLPNNFNGGLSDALRLMADYHDAVKGTDKQDIGGIIDKNNKPDLWGDFITAVKMDKHLNGGFVKAIYEKDKDDIYDHDEFLKK